MLEKLDLDLQGMELDFITYLVMAEKKYGDPIYCTVDGDEIEHLRFKNGFWVVQYRNGDITITNQMTIELIKSGESVIYDDRK